MNKFSLVGASIGAAMTVFACAANAASITPEYADCDPNVSNIGSTGTCSGDANRTDASRINFGDGDGFFYSLGLSTNGSISDLVLRINPSFTGPATVVEVTNPGTNHLEAADVFVATEDASGGYDANSNIFLQRITNNGSSGGSVSTIDFTGTFQFLVFRDASLFEFSSTGSTDGFDIDAISVSAVPLPASGLMMLGIAAGIGYVGRRRRSAA
jgi:hypothetical protein